MASLSTQAALFTDLYGPAAKDAPARYDALAQWLAQEYGHAAPRFFSAPGRTEIGGNHTDHQNGHVLAAAVSMDALAAAAPNGGSIVRLRSQGFPGEFVVDLAVREPQEAERNTTQALIRGVAARMAVLGRPVGGFDAVVQSTVLRGSGLSSSTAIEVLLVTIFDCLFGAGDIDPKERAIIARYAENVFFGKPCGLMDQMASSVGGLITIDFKDVDHPNVRKLDFDFSKSGYDIIVTDTRGSHDDLTDQYAAIPAEMGAVAREFGAETLSQVEEDAFLAHIPALGAKLGERPILRAMHFFGDDRRVVRQARALEAQDMDAFLKLVEESGRSSWQLLQNCYAPLGEQKIPLALALSARILNDQGASRVHGGGFAGTIQAFVPQDMTLSYCGQMESYFGEGACTVLSVRPQGAMEVVF